MTKRILVALSAGQHSRRVMQAAIEQALAHKAQVLIIHVEDPEPAFVGYRPGPAYVRKSVSKAIRKDHKLLHRIERRFKAKGIKTTALLIQGLTDQKILKEARMFKADLIVMGYHKRRVVSKFLLGSVSEGVLRRAPCPVLLVEE